MGQFLAGGNINGDVKEFSISPDSSRVAYMADQNAAGLRELYSVSIGGGTVTKLNSSLVSGGDVWDFSISPDSSRVVYMAEQDTAGALELFGVYDSSYNKYNILFFIPPILSGT